jgi:broad specificity phosphatase PhoE
VEKEKANRVSAPFPNGESYTQSSARVNEFLQDIAQKYDGKKILIIGHRATQYALEHLINKVPLEKIVSTSWKWAPGWTYTY